MLAHPPRCIVRSTGRPCSGTVLLSPVGPRVRPIVPLLAIRRTVEIKPEKAGARHAEAKDCRWDHDGESPTRRAIKPAGKACHRRLAVPSFKSAVFGYISTCPSISGGEAETAGRGVIELRQIPFPAWRTTMAQACRRVVIELSFVPAGCQVHRGAIQQRGFDTGARGRDDQLRAKDFLPIVVDAQERSELWGQWAPQSHGPGLSFPASSICRTGLDCCTCSGGSRTEPRMPPEPAHGYTSR